VLPRKCNLSAGPNGVGGQCTSMDPWQVLTNKSTFADQQTLKIQARRPLLRCLTHRLRASAMLAAA
jgi:UDP-N-acetyl-D-mannosaminuronate dehydrogenase